MAVMNRRVVAGGSGYDTPMRICLFTSTFLPKIGGTENVTDCLAREFHRMGHEPLVLAQGEPAHLDVPYAVRWFRKPWFVKHKPERTAVALRKAHAELLFDVVCVNYANPTGYGAAKFGEATGVPIVMVSHGGDLYRSSSDRDRPAIWKRTEYAYRHVDGLVAISPYIKQLIHEIEPSPRRLVMIPNGIDLEEFAQPADRPSDFPDERPFLLALGNLGPMKGFDDAIAAYAKVRDRLGDRLLVIVGEGDLGPALRKQANDLNIAQHVRFMGRRVGDDKRWFLHACDFGLMPSIEEGHPIVGLEFLATGKPLVCTTNAAFDGMYDDGVNAFRVEPRGRDELGQAMAKLAGMPDGERAAMRDECLRRSKAYAWDATADKYLRFFERVISEKSADG